MPSTSASVRNRSLRPRRIRANVEILPAIGRLRELLPFGPAHRSVSDIFLILVANSTSRSGRPAKTAQTPASEMPERDKWFELTYIIPSVTARSKPSTARLEASAVLQPPAMRYNALAALLLAACSGGGNNPTPPNPPWSKVAAHVLRLAGILAYLDWAWRTAGRSLLVGEPNQIGACFVTAGLFLAAHPCRAAADRVERAACQCTSCASLDLQEW